MVKRTLSLAVVVCSAFSPVCYGLDAPQNCSLATLKGTYIYASSGLEDGKFNAEGGIEIYDGKGGMTLINVFEDGKTVVSQGHYTMGGRCVGGGSYDLWKTTYVFYAGPSGAEFTWNTIGGGKQWAGINYRTTSSLSPGCSQKTLKGTYVYSFSGYRDGLPYFESGKDIYDGRGNLINIRVDPDGKEQSIAGTYTIDQYCAGLRTLQNQNAVAIYAYPNGSRIYDASPANSVGNMIVGPEDRVSLR